MTAPCPSRDYFPQPRARATAPAADAPTFLDAVRAFIDDFDNPSPPQSP